MEFAITKYADSVAIQLDFSKDGLTDDEYNGLFEFEGLWDEFLSPPHNWLPNTPRRSILVYRVKPEDMEEVALTLIRDMLTQLSSVFDWRVSELIKPKIADLDPDLK